jgi:hypothetical protein
MGIGGFERRLEHLVEGVFARVFRSGLKPVELGRRIARELDTNRSVGVRGTTTVPNHFTVVLSVADAENLAGILESLSGELADAAREHARDEGYTFCGPVEVDITTDERLHTGEFRITPEMRAGPGGVGAGSLVLPDGQRFVLDDEVVTIGRLNDCHVMLSDPKASRHHAEIRPEGDHFVVVDLGSTNGTRVNGLQVGQQTLRDGDELTFGNTRILFQAS